MSCVTTGSGEDSTQQEQSLGFCSESDGSMGQEFEAGFALEQHAGLASEFATASLLQHGLAVVVG
ncbi:MAG: hypothetical protein J0M26_12950 [Planctomycetes bacterium]|nr:hypothetical protein [Planctomycetota bacterium]